MHKMAISSQDMQYLRNAIAHQYQKLLKRHRIEPDDVVQQTLEHAVRSWHRFQGRSTMRTWLVGIAKNTLLMECRARTTRKHDVPNGIDPVHRPSNHDLERCYAAREALFLYAKAMSHEQRQTLILQIAHGYSRDEISVMLGIPVATVGTRIFYARERMAMTRAELTL